MYIYIYIWLFAKSVHASPSTRPALYQTLFQHLRRITLYQTLFQNSHGNLVPSCRGNLVPELAAALLRSIPIGWTFWADPMGRAFWGAGALWTLDLVPTLHHAILRIAGYLWECINPAELWDHFAPEGGRGALYQMAARTLYHWGPKQPCTKLCLVNTPFTLDQTLYR